MADKFEDVDIPDEILDFIAGGNLSNADMADMRRYVGVFKSKKFDLKLTQIYWVEHMQKSHVTSYTEQEARDFIAKIWNTV